MTLSLIHYNPKTKLAATITATGSVAVGGFVNHSWRGLGACATQGLYTNPWYPEYTKKFLFENYNSSQIIDLLKSNDINYDQRQFGVIDKQGTASVINGLKNIPFCGSLAVSHSLVLGNILKDKEVLNNFLNRFLSEITKNPIEVINGEQPNYIENYEEILPITLINALEEAINSGGDKRGVFSGSLRIESYQYPPVDIRVDWSKKNLINKMRFILSKTKEKDFQDFLSNLPKK